MSREERRGREREREQIFEKETQTERERERYSCKSGRERKRWLREGWGPRMKKRKNSVRQKKRGKERLTGGEGGIERAWREGWRER